MENSLIIKLRIFNSILIIYSIIFTLRAIYWFHNPTAAILWFLDTPVDLIVLGIAFITRTNLLKNNRIHQQNANPSTVITTKPSEKVADLASKGIGIALILFVLIGILAMIMFAVFTSVH